MASLVAELKLVISGFRKSLADADKAQKQLGASASGVKVGDKLFSGVAPAAQGMSRNADAAFRQVQRSAERAFKGVNSSAGMMTGGINGMLSQIGIGALRDVGARLVGFFTNLGPQIRSSLARGMEQEQMEMSFGALSGGQGAEVFEELRQQSLATGIAIDQMSGSVQKFMAMEMSPEEAIKLNKAILDIGGSIGATAYETGLIGTALAQVKSKGVASMEELRQQIGERGVPIFKALAESLNMDTPELFKAIQKGEVSAEAVISVFRDMKGPFAAFEGGAARLGGTMSGMLSRIGATFTELRRDIEFSLVGPMKPAFEFVLAKMQEAREVVGQTVAMFQSIFASGSGVTILTGLLKIGFQEATNLLYQSLIGGFAAASGLWMEGIKNGITLFEILRTKDFWKGMADALLAAGHGLATLLLDMVATVLEQLATLKIPGMAAAAGIARGMADTNKKYAVESGGDAADLLTPAFEKAAGRMGDAVSSTLDRFKKGFEGAGKIFDTTDEREKLAEELAKHRKDPANRPGLPDFKGNPSAAPSAGDDLTGGAAGSRQVFGGTLRSTIDLILGRSEQAIMTVELKTQTTLLAKIAENTKPKEPKSPMHVMAMRDPVFS